MIFCYVLVFYVLLLTSISFLRFLMSGKVVFFLILVCLNGKIYIPVHVDSVHSSLHVLLFNVRGLSLRWQEILLLAPSLGFDVLILLEIGSIDLSFYQKIFNNFRMFHQTGERRNEGVLVLMKHDLLVKRLECKLANVCIIDIEGENVLRIIGVYAPESKSWTWDDLSLFLSKKCIIFGDFNVDIDCNGKKAEIFLDWADKNFLAPFAPNSSTSLRSDRVIDFALACGVNLDIQTYNGNTSSDHIPIISIIPILAKNKRLGRNIH